MDPKKFLFISYDALISDVAWHVVTEGNEVKYYIDEKDEKDIADGFVPKTDDWQKETDWADVIVFDDVLGFGKIAKKLREAGKKVVGGTPYTDMLEDDRAFGQEELKKAGVGIIPHQDYTSFDEAIEFVKKNPDKYVVKPSGKAQNEKQFLFIGQEDDGRDVVQLLEAYKKAWSKIIKSFQLQKRIMGVEVAVGAFFNGNEFVYPINVNFEHKKFFPGDLGPQTGEMGCYDDQTEVLTNNGWKLFKDLNYDDKICTLKPQDHIIEYHKPTKIVMFRHHKQLIAIQNQTLDIRVTLDHLMYVASQWNARKNKNKFSFIKAKQLEYQSLIKRTGKWLGKKGKYFYLPAVSWIHNKYTINKAEIKIPMDKWLAFMGIWIADGYTSINKVGIAQKIPKKKKKIEKLLKQLPFKYKKRQSEFYIYNKQLYSYLKPLGKAPEKFIPLFIKELSEKQIKIFLDWFALGDGTMMKNKFRIFYTCSKKLADDIQELLLKINRVGVIKKRKRLGKVWIKDHFADSSKIQYEILERVKKLNSWIDRRDIKTIPYNGKVYCATVKNHIMYVRRNGKPYWCGNTSMFWSAPNKFFNATLKKMEPKLQKENYVGYIDINCIVNNNGIYPLEFTARFGYPTISIQQEGINMPIGEFLAELAAGTMTNFKTKSGFQVGVIIVVPPFPFDDQKTLDSLSKDNVIFFKKPSLEGVHIDEVKKINGDWLITGVAGEVLTIVGCGQTMKQAQDQAYHRIKNILIPNMYYRDDIGDRWFEDSDKLHNWGYLREV